MRNALLSDLRKARVDLRRHLDVGVLRFRVFLRLWLFFRLGPLRRLTILLVALIVGRFFFV